MQADAMRAADWYDDPERPGQLRYWDGSAWTEHRAEPRQPLVAEAAQAAVPGTPQPAQQTAQQTGQPKPEGEETSFGLVVAAVLGGAAVLIAMIVVLVVWIDSYNTGKGRGEDAARQGIPPSQADTYCQGLAKDLSRPGSAEGFWDMPWIWGCKRGLG